MIHYLPYSKINKDKYDACLSGAFNRRIYAFSAFLDRLSPQWGALVLMDKRENYQKVMPLTWRKKWGIHYLYQPVMTQQLGVFSSIDKAPFPVDDFINAIPKKFKLIEISLNFGNIIAQPKTYMKIRQRNNYELKLDKSYKELYQNYFKRHKRNVKHKNNEVPFNIHENTLDCKELFNYIMDFYNYKKIQYKDVDKKAFYMLINYLNNNNKIKKILIKDELGEILGGSFFIYDKQFILPGAFYTEKWRKSSPGYKIIDILIQAEAEQNLIIDFMGSDIPGVAYLNKGFGSKHYTYPMLRINHLPFPINQIKK